jgi:hypothetical protein
MNELETKGLSSEAYRTFFEEIVAKGEPYGPPDAGHGIDYTKLNLARTRRIEKTLKVPANVQEAMAKARPQSWMVITEPWCGDGAQNLPVLQALAALAPKIDMHILLRDSHLEVMDRYLTNGGRSIPKLVAFDGEGKELFQWGPRPAAAQALVLGNKTLPEAERLDKDALAEALHRWYHGNGGMEVMNELVALVRSYAF